MSDDRGQTTKDRSVPRQLSSAVREVGFPIRKFTDQSLFAAPHDLSQRTTSFFASQRQGIHRILLRHLIALIINAHHTLLSTRDLAPKTRQCFGITRCGRPPEPGKPRTSIVLRCARIPKPFDPSEPAHRRFRMNQPPRLAPYKARAIREIMLKDQFASNTPGSEAVKLAH